MYSDRISSPHHMSIDWLRTGDRMLHRRATMTNRPDYRLCRMRFERVSRKLTRFALLAGALLAGGARADDSDPPMFSFSGFGTLGEVHSSQDKADFSSSPLRISGAGQSGSWSSDVDSLLAAQVTANFTPRLSAVVQVISEQNYDDTYRPHVEWANIRYRFTPDFSVRAGRTVLPVFLLSDTRKVGYTFPWVRPPQEVYRLLPITSSDGIEADYDMSVGDLTHTLQANYGKNALRVPPAGSRLEGVNSWGIAYGVEYGAITAQATYHRSNVTLDSFNALFDGFRQFGPQGIALAHKYDVDGKPFEVIAVGARYDPGKWFMMAELTRTDSRSVIGRETGWYVSGGYRFGKLTPYVTYGRVTADNLSDPGLDLSTLPPTLAEQAGGLNAALNGALSSKPVQQTISIGGRWDLTRHTDFKLQYDHTRVGAGSTGGLINIQPGFQLGSGFNVISLAFDFVF
jgi:hypothetical protein